MTLGSINGVTEGMLSYLHILNTSVLSSPCMDVLRGAAPFPAVPMVACDLVGLVRAVSMSVYRKVLVAPVSRVMRRILFSGPSHAGSCLFM